ncbi:alpha/beta hydrolase [Streptomyces sp. NPDC026673]|uniref:alpha/beta hydrolase n=1 Tax=Streptomyces sp. NPDC026673 TaxID=3155724 RepID=UPI0033C4BFFD
MDAVRHTGHGRRGTGRRGAVALLSTCALLATACASLDAGHAPAATRLAPDGAAPAEAVPPGLARYYGQKLHWKPCADQPSFQCTTLKAPLDYAHPEAGDISLAATRMKSTGTGAERIGSLLYNPGGPGESAVSGLWGLGPAFSSGVRAAYDLVAVDPRGVGDSTPVECDADASAGLPESGPAAVAGLSDFTVLDEEREEIAETCRLGAGRLLPHVGTPDAARDMDLMRALVGDGRLHFLGFSYGTYLGATYAELFPSHVGRMVLDGGMDPALDGYHRMLNSARGYQVAWESFAADCATRADCPVGRSVAEADRALDALVADLDRNPLREGKDITFTGDDLLRVVSDALRAPDWEQLRAGLREAASAGDTVSLQKLSGAAQEESGSGYEWYTAVSCLSGMLGPRYTPAQTEAALPAFRRASPQFWTYYIDFLTLCRHWPAGPSQPSHAITAPGAPPILVVGTTRDPATPYAWSQALARELSSARLLTWDGDGHTAYIQPEGSACVDNAVDRYLLSGQLPPAGTVCH